MAEGAGRDRRMRRWSEADREVVKELQASLEKEGWRVTVDTLASEIWVSNRMGRVLRLYPEIMN